MPKLDRQDGPFAIHHVMNRGIARRGIFLDEKDRRYFLARMAWEVKRGLIRVHAFALMETHFHLLLTSETGDLDLAMQRIQQRVTRRFNRRTGRDGPLFRGRFKSVLVKDDAYWLVVHCYIVNNPVKAGLVSRPESYPYGSAWYHGKRRFPRWLRRSPFDTAASRGFAPTTEGQAWVVERTLSRVRPAPVTWPDHDGEPLAGWLAQRSLLADGRADWAPATSPGDLVIEVAHHEQKEPELRVHPGRRGLSAWPILRAGLLRSLCGLGRDEIAREIGRAPTTVRTYLAHHAALLARDETYAELCRRVASRALVRIRPRRPGHRCPDGGGWGAD